jgi:hypothetical protein
MYTCDTIMHRSILSVADTKLLQSFALVEVCAQDALSWVAIGATQSK